jgi:hypothetical protein
LIHIHWHLDPSCKGYIMVGGEGTGKGESVVFGFWAPFGLPTSVAVASNAELGSGACCEEQRRCGGTR